MPLLDRGLVKSEAVLAVAKAHGWNVNPYFPPSLREFAHRLLSEDPLSKELPLKEFGTEECIEPPISIGLRPPTLLNGFPAAFGHYPLPTETSVPAFNVLRVKGGVLRLMSDAPTVLDEDGSIHPRFSSFYFPLLPHYAQAESKADDCLRQIDGRLLVLLDDVGALNYCHWLVDWLPRLRALSGDLDDVYVAILALGPQWQTDTLTAFGIREDHIISIRPWGAVQARELIVPAHLSEVWHPAYKGSSWALKVVKKALAPERPVPAVHAGRKILLSRSDARVRHISNEEELFRAIQPLGFEKVVSQGLTVKQQAEIFSECSQVISLHGAGLSNIIFCQPKTKVLEIVPSQYGTPAFWILACGASLDYATYVADSIAEAGLSQHEDVKVNVSDFVSRAVPWLEE